MGDVVQLFHQPDRDKRGRVILEIDQKWVEQKTGTIWVVVDIETRMVNDRVVATHIYLEDLDGLPCDSVYTETYFRRWFYEISEPRRRDNRSRLRKQGANLKYWHMVGLVILGGTPQ